MHYSYYIFFIFRMPEVDDYFREVDVNKWSYDGFLKFLTTEKCSEEIWISSLRAISKNKKYPVRCRKKANHILNDYSSVIVFIPSKQSTTIFNIWNRLRKKTENDRYY